METIKPQELRIGNKALYKFWNPEPNNEHWAYSEVTIVGILKDTFYFTSRNDKRISKIGELYAIPITEERLLQLGFESNPYQDRYELGDIHVECDKTKGTTQLWIEGKPHIKFIHHIQNLHHANKGEELTFKQVEQ